MDESNDLDVSRRKAIADLGAVRVDEDRYALSTVPAGNWFLVSTSTLLRFHKHWQIRFDADKDRNWEEIMWNAVKSYDRVYVGSMCEMPSWWSPSSRRVTRVSYANGRVKYFPWQEMQYLLDAHENAEIIACNYATGEPYVVDALEQASFKIVNLNVDEPCASSEEMANGVFDLDGKDRKTVTSFLNAYRQAPSLHHRLDAAKSLARFVRDAVGMDVNVVYLGEDPAISHILCQAFEDEGFEPLFKALRWDAVRGKYVRKGFERLEDIEARAEDFGCNVGGFFID